MATFYLLLLTASICLAPAILAQPSDPRIIKCSHHSEAGPCRASHRRFFFDRTMGSCAEFTYGGCGGNENNFRTLEECQQTCFGVSQCPMVDVIPITEEERRRGCRYESRQMEDGCWLPQRICPDEDPTPNPSPSPDTIKRCSHQKETGTCRGSLRRFFYDRTRTECVPFTYGGCGGNANNFETEAECRSTCAGVEACPMVRIRAPTPEEESRGCSIQRLQAEDGCWLPEIVCPEVASGVAPLRLSSAAAWLLGAGLFRLVIQMIR